MTRTEWYIAAGLLTFGLTIAGCSPDITETEFYSRHPDPASLEPPALRSLGVASEGDFEVELLTRTDPHAGHNVLSVRASRAGAPVETATLQLQPVLDGVPSPWYAPSESTADEDGLLEVAGLFLQPKGPDQTWDVRLTLSAGASSAELAFSFAVVDSLWMQTFDVPSTGDAVFVSWVTPVRPTTGDADFEVSIHRRTAVGFERLENATLDLYPYMDMGAGEGHSTPYKAPVYATAGVYRGRVNFIMSGGWDMTVYVSIPGEPQQAVVFRGFTVY